MTTCKRRQWQKKRPLLYIAERDTHHHGVQLWRASAPTRRPPPPIPNNLHTRAISENARAS